MRRDTDTSVMQYNTIFYSATMSIYCFIFAVLILVVVLVVAVTCIIFLLCLLSAGGGQNNSDICKNTSTLNCGGCDCGSCFICSKADNDRKTRKF